MSEQHSTTVARMVDVGDKPVTQRTAAAEALIQTSPATVERVREGRVEKGDVLRVSEVAGLYAIKRAADLLPMCHPIAVSGAELRVEIVGDDRLRVLASARTNDRTGVEMEVLTAASVAALCVYDLLKMYDPGIVIGPVQLLSKTGGKNGDWVRTGERGS